MRRTITLEADVVALDETPFETPSFRMGRPAVSLVHALRLAADSEDEVIVREVDLQK